MTVRLTDNTSSDMTWQYWPDSEAVLVYEQGLAVQVEIEVAVPAGWGGLRGLGGGGVDRALGGGRVDCALGGGGFVYALGAGVGGGGAPLCHTILQTTKRLDEIEVILGRSHTNQRLIWTVNAFCQFPVDYGQTISQKLFQCFIYMCVLPTSNELCVLACGCLERSSHNSMNRLK